MRRAILLLLLGVVVGIVALAALFDRNVAAPTVRQESLSQPHVYAYTRLAERGRALAGRRPGGDPRRWRVAVHAGRSSRAGRARPLSAPSFYPIPYVPGGVLIGRIGEKGQPFVVGRRTSVYAEEPGLLYLRINDDRLGDNWGWVAVDVEVTEAED